MPKFEIINVTPHPITFMSPEGAVYEVPSSGVVINASVVTVQAENHWGGAMLERVEFQPHPEGLAQLKQLAANHPNAVVVGSIIAAQAYPGQVFALSPVPGFERVPPAEKRMRDNLFVTYQR